MAIPRSAMGRDIGQIVLDQIAKGGLAPQRLIDKQATMGTRMSL